MKVTEIDQEQIDILRLFGGHEKSPRSTDVPHVKSTINHMIRTATGKAPGNWSEKPLNAAAQLGFAFEEMLSQAVVGLANGDFFIRPGEQRLDGMCGNPDLLRASDGRVFESKVKYKSSRAWDTWPETFPDIDWQLRAYCKMLGTTRAGLIILFINGDYRDSGPQVRGCEIEYGQRELDSSWRAIRNHARSLASMQGIES